MILFLLFTTLESTVRPMAPTEGGFTARLIHRDSPLSPFYDHAVTDTARIEATIHRSRSRLNYLMSFNIGNPPSQVLGFADTSNGLIWVQCSDCNSQCEPEKGGPTTKFLSSKSFTYEMEPCGSNFCNSLTGFQTCNSS